MLSEVEETCSRVGIIRDGRLVSDMTMDKVHELRFHEVVIEFGGDVPEAAVRAAAGVEDVAVDGRTAHLHRARRLRRVCSRRSAATRWSTWSAREPSLESIFLSYYSK